MDPAVSLPDIHLGVGVEHLDAGDPFKRQQVIGNEAAPVGMGNEHHGACPAERPNDVLGRERLAGCHVAREIDHLPEPDPDEVIRLPQLRATDVDLGARDDQHLASSGRADRGHLIVVGDRDDIVPLLRVPGGRRLDRARPIGVRGVAVKHAPVEAAGTGERVQQLGHASPSS